jgi:hypothetical protein
MRFPAGARRFDNHDRTPGVRSWSAAEIRQLKHLAQQGLPLKDIARHLRRTESALRNKAVMHGISLRPVAKDRAAG